MDHLLAVVHILLNQDVSHGRDGPVSIVSTISRYVPTGLFIVRIPWSTKSNPGIIRVAIILVITSDTNSCLWKVILVGFSIEPFPVTVVL